MRRGLDVVGLCECERSGPAADESRVPSVPEPSAAAQEYGGAAAAAPQPPAAGQPPEAHQRRQCTACAYHMATIVKYDVMPSE